MPDYVAMVIGLRRAREYLKKKLGIDIADADIVAIPWDMKLNVNWLNYVDDYKNGYYKDANQLYDAIVYGRMRQWRLWLSRLNAERALDRYAYLEGVANLGRLKAIAKREELKALKEFKFEKPIARNFLSLLLLALPLSCDKLRKLRKLLKVGSGGGP